MKLLFMLIGVTIVLWMFFRRRITGHVPAIKPSELAEAMDSGANSVVIDVRPRNYFKQGSIPGSVNWPLGEMESSIEKAEKWRGKRLVIVCHSGYSGQVILAPHMFQVLDGYCVFMASPEEHIDWITTNNPLNR